MFSDSSNGIFVTMAMNAIRSVLNKIIGSVKPSDLVNVIRDDRSLWGESSDHISNIANNIPPFVRNHADAYIRKIETEMGGVSPLVIRWIREDQPILHMIIINTEGGCDWLDRQVYGILEGLGIYVRD